MLFDPCMNWSLRSATSDDLDGICDVIHEYSRAIHGIGNDSKRAVELTWGQPGFDVDRDTRVAELSDGRIVGYGEIEDLEEPHAKIAGWLRVHPDCNGRGLESELLAWCEARAIQSVKLAPEHLRVTLGFGVPESDSFLNELLAKDDYGLIRHFWRMVIELDHDIPEPAWPAGVTVRTFVLSEDLEAMVRASRDSFQDHWGHVDTPFEEELEMWDHWIRNDPRFDPGLTFLAIADDEIVGFSSCDPMNAEDPKMGFIDVLGVRRAWRRRGIAMALLHHTFREFKKRGQERVGLGVDATSLTGANRVYETAGMKPVRQINVYEKELRAGVDPSLRDLEEGENA